MTPNFDSAGVSPNIRTNNRLIVNFYPHDLLSDTLGSRN
jgi:hypothetical protein